jgi:hypothetical protein
MITPEELIIEMMPFPKELREFCKTNPSFSKALKIIYFDRFIALQAVGTSYSPNYPEDEVIGIYVYDYGLKNPKFKQDFIINKRGQKKEFVLYTGLSSVVDNKYVRHINEFLAKYGKGGYYKNAHWPKFEEFSGKLKERALSAIELANKRKKDGYIKINPQQAEEIFNKLKALRGEV